MKIEKSGLTLEVEELVEIQTIILDEDARAALEFLKHLRNKIDVQQRKQCGSKLVRGEGSD